MNTFTTLSGTERQLQIRDLIDRNRRISVADICEVFAVSEATARRDLETLTEQGLVQRVHGGAIAVEKQQPEFPIMERQDLFPREKQAIGEATARLVNNGETIFLGSGTTVLAVARALLKHKNLTIITNSLPVMNILNKTEHTIISLGGALRASELSFIGHVTEQAASEFRADKVIIGTPAVSLQHGLSHDYLPETMTDRAVLKIGSRIIIVADHSKFEKVATSFLAPVEKIDTIVTDSETPAEVVEALRERGIEVIPAGAGRL
jgi:DeoR/GlpR family transcriptional regulator of sugar metabolism